MSTALGTLLAVLLSLVSAAGYAFAAVAQSRLASANPAGQGSLRRLLGRPQWWWSVGLNAAGALAHVAALRYGPLTLVQPLGALTLVVALPIGAYGAGRRVGRTEWRGAAWTLAGLVGLIAVTGPVAPGEILDMRETLIVTGVTLLVIAVLAGRSRARMGTGSRGRGLGHAMASGVAGAVGSALTQTLTVAFAQDLPGGPTAWWETTVLALLIAAFAAGGLVLAQAAYQGGLAAPLAVVNIANPTAAAVIGVALLGETFRAGSWGWLVAALAALMAGRGVLLLTAGLEPETGSGAESGAEAALAPVPPPPPVAGRKPSLAGGPVPETVPETVPAGAGAPGGRAPTAAPGGRATTTAPGPFPMETLHVRDAWDGRDGREPGDVPRPRTASNPVPEPAR
ncbi:DMT family transporter [Streptomyces sp. NPDC048718]|uniref:DMT family transporter n=1 Tax=Streptomyces sp. NPDC048718 TaxID=3365587 RepID=UPI003716B150